MFPIAIGYEENLRKIYANLKNVLFVPLLDGKVVRGCLSQLVPGEVSLCESGRDCKLCQGDNCNGKVNFQSCYNCNSASDPTCAIFSANENSVMKTCTDYLDQCVTYFSEFQSPTPTPSQRHNLITKLQIMALSTADVAMSTISSVPPDRVLFAPITIVTHNHQLLRVSCPATNAIPRRMSIV